MKKTHFSTRRLQMSIAVSILGTFSLGLAGLVSAQGTLPSGPGDCAGLPSHEYPSKRDASHDRLKMGRAVRARVDRRIARERGCDVIVVLQRTSPPYDREYLRGSNRVPDRSPAKVLACSFALT